MTGEGKFDGETEYRGAAEREGNKHAVRTF